MSFKKKTKWPTNDLETLVKGQGQQCVAPSIPHNAKIVDNFLLNVSQSNFDFQPQTGTESVKIMIVTILLKTAGRELKIFASKS